MGTACRGCVHLLSCSSAASSDSLVVSQEVPDAACHPQPLLHIQVARRLIKHVTSKGGKMEARQPLPSLTPPLPSPTLPGPVPPFPSLTPLFPSLHPFTAPQLTCLRTGRTRQHKQISVALHRSSVQCLSPSLSLGLQNNASP